MDENKYCRLCLTTSVVYYSLFKNDGTKMLFSLTGIEISEDYPFPAEVCAKCWIDLKLAYQIQQKFLEAEKTFQLTGVHSVESKIELFNKKPESNEDESKTERIDSFFKQEDTEDFIPKPDNDLNLNDIEEDDDGPYPEVIYIETEELDQSEKEDLKCFCPICGNNFPDNGTLYCHINSHYDEPQECDECSLKLPNINAYREHVERVHPKYAKKTHVCGICQLSFRYKSLFKFHLSSLHATTAKGRKRNKENSCKFDAQGNDLQCGECNKVLGSMRAFKVHIKGHSRKPCPVCGALITIYNLSKHIAMHKSTPAVCHLCGATSKNQESLRGHMYYTHSQKRLNCEICGREFKKLYAYKMHVKKEHTGERNLVCDTCGKRFFTNYELNNHIKTKHLKERKHICQFCKKGFSSRFAMRTHERQHTNEAPYVCEICGEGFRQNVSLRTHRKSKHNVYEKMKVQCTICSKMFINDWALKSHTRSVHD